MPRYRARHTEDSAHNLLLTAGVVAGLLAGAVVAQKLGGWRGIRRVVRRARRRGLPALALVGELLPTGTLRSLLRVVDMDDILALLAGGVRGLGRSAAAAPPRARRRRARQPDPDLDESEVDPLERSAAGYAPEDEPEDDVEYVDGSGDDVAGERDDDMDDEIVEPLAPESIERAVLAAFREHPVLRRRALEIGVDDEGVLELTGWVRRERELRLARRIATRVPGVEAVRVDVAVRDTPRPIARADSSSP